MRDTPNLIRRLDARVALILLPGGNALLQVSNHLAAEIAQIPHLWRFARCSCSRP